MSITLHQPNPAVPGQEGPTDQQRSPQPIPSDKAPQKLYAEMVQRPDL